MLSNSFSKEEWALVKPSTSFTDRNRVKRYYVHSPSKSAQAQTALANALQHLRALPKESPWNTSCRLGPCKLTTCLRMKDHMMTHQGSIHPETLIATRDASSDASHTRLKRQRPRRDEVQNSGTTRPPPMEGRCVKTRILHRLTTTQKPHPSTRPTPLKHTRQVSPSLL